MNTHLQIHGLFAGLLMQFSTLLLPANVQAAMQNEETSVSVLASVSATNPASIFTSSYELGEEWYWNSLFGYFYHGYYPFIYVWDTSEWVYITGDSESNATSYTVSGNLIGDGRMRVYIPTMWNCPIQLVYG